MTTDDALAMTQTLAALRGEIIDLRAQLFDARADLAYWKRKAKDAEIERDQINDSVSCARYGRIM
jgi:hypothetical protein